MVEQVARTLWVVVSSSWTRETVRLALDAESGWHPAFFPSVAALADELDRLDTTESPAPLAPLAPPAPLAVLAPVPAADELALAAAHLPLILYGTPDQFVGPIPEQCDDILVEPWGRAELLFRLGRLGGPGVVSFAAGSLSWGPYWIEADQTGGPRRRVPVSRLHYTLFDLLARNAARPVSRNAVEAACGAGSYGGRALDMQVSRLRSTLAEATDGWDPAPRIRAYRGHGYRLEDG